ncbi:ABC transporter permease [Salinigranum salinum]|uniref:ABC transporter permease n=1 Tax=Salinigranum salinum TaxID=1364937 RepID=UPI0012606375|nr:ABC transporter permease [Salinigranum salinum]
MSTVRYFVNRTLQTVLLLWGILTFLFLLFRAMPGDPGTLMLNAGASPEAVAAARARWGLDQPIHIQYLQYTKSLATFNLGNSLTSGVPVWELVRMKIFNTFILVGPATVAFYILGSLVGAVLGSKRGTKLESYGIIPFFILGTMPSFFLSIILVVVFAMYFDLFPTSGMFSPGFLALHPEWPWWRPYFTQTFLEHYILPFTAVVLRYVYSPLLVMRTSVTEVMGQDFTYYHRITGLPSRKRLKHISKHASLPVITLFPTSMLQAVSGLVLIEVVFNWPGIGNLLVQSILARDYPVVQFVFFAAAVSVVIGNYAVDILYGVIDPRVSVTDD